MGVVVIHLGAAALEEVEQLERWALARVVDVLLVSHAQEQDLGPLEGLAAVVERVLNFAHHVAGHGHVHFAGELDEARGDAVLARLPRQVERVERNAVTAEPGAGVEAHEPEGLGLGGVEHVPHVDAHAVVDDLELVHERDVHGAEDVLGELGRFGGARRAHADDLAHRRFVEIRCELARSLVDTPHHLRDRAVLVLLVAGVLALR